MQIFFDSELVEWLQYSSLSNSTALFISTASLQAAIFSAFRASHCIISCFRLRDAFLSSSLRLNLYSKLKNSFSQREARSASWISPLHELNSLDYIASLVITAASHCLKSKDSLLKAPHNPIFC